MNRRQRKKYLKGNVGRIRKYIEHQINSGSGVAVTLPANLGVSEGAIWEMIRAAQENRAQKRKADRRAKRDMLHD